MDPARPPLAVPAMVRDHARRSAVAMSILFAAVTVLVAVGKTTRIDHLLDSASFSNLPHSVRVSRRTILLASDPRYTLVLAVGLGFVLTHVTRRRHHAVQALVAIGPWLVLTMALKYLIDRTLPGEGGGLGYPSGHTGSLVVLTGLAILALIELRPAGAARRVAIGALAALPLTLAVVLLTGHYHWFTDIVGGAALAIACLSASVWFTPSIVAAMQRSTGRADPIDDHAC